MHVMTEEENSARHRRVENLVIKHLRDHADSIESEIEMLITIDIPKAAAILKPVKATIERAIAQLEAKHEAEDDHG